MSKPRRNISRRTALRSAGHIVALAAAVALVACAPRVDVRGHVPDPEALAQIKPGHQTRDQVAALLGTPSAIGTFDDARWYYVTRKTETLAFYEPELVEQSVVVIEFDVAGFVKQVITIDEEEAREIDLVSRETPTKGKKFGFLEQIFGNLGAPVGRGN